MKIFRDIDSYSCDRPVYLTQGTFDGVHLGHQRILQRLKQAAEQNGGAATLLTFDPHPRTVLYPEQSGLKLLTTMDEKIDILESLGLDQLIILPFTLELSRLPAMNFVRDFLVGKIHMKHFIVGYDHRFGKNREGSFEELKQYSDTFDFTLEEIPAREVEDCTISSTKIRNAIDSGDIETANTYLGREYQLRGKVIHGKGLGKGLGFPTANIELQSNNKIVPGNGVYCVDIQHNGKTYGGMLNIGDNPTIPHAKWSIEVNIFNFKNDIYGHDLEIRFVSKMRDEIKFDSLSDLKNQLVQDQELAIKLLNERG